MTSHQQNTLVGIFAFTGVLILIAILAQFDNLPTKYSQLGAYQVEAKFPKIPGIETSSVVYFKGFIVGKVTQVNPPSLQQNKEGQHQYQVGVRIAIQNDFAIPSQATCKLFKRGLGTSYLEFVIAPEVNITTETMKDGDIITGEISTGSEFINEATQSKLDNIINSIDKLTLSLQNQLSPVSPQDVDNAPENSKIYPNATTAIMRLDTTLKNLNAIVGDIEMQGDLKETLAHMSIAARNFPDMINQISRTTGKFDTLATRADTAICESTLALKETTTKLSGSLDAINHLIGDINFGTGTTAKLIHDDALYESLTKTSKDLSSTMAELNIVFKGIQKNGLLKYKGTQK